MKVLLITSPRITGLNYHRQLVPFTTLEGVEAVAYNIWDDTWTDDFLKDFPIVSFLRTIDLMGRTQEILDRLHKLGCKVHFDIDDYWVLPVNHALYPNFKAQNVSAQVIEALKGSDLITTSTKHLAKVIEQHNTNVYVLPNAINPLEEQWEKVEVKNDLLRFGYIAGVHHIQDVEIMKPSIDKLWDDKYSKDKFQLAVAGFNINTIEGVQSMNPYYHYVEHLFLDKFITIKEDSVYKKVLCNKYSNLKDFNYIQYLMNNNPIDNEATFDKPYRRLWGLDTFNYGKLYNLIDVSLVPLAPNMFSACKSELKLIEAGFMKKAVIVSNVRPYDNVANKDNSILITANKGKEWYNAMRSLIADKNKVEDLGEAMYETVKDKFHINTVNVERKQILDRLCQ